MKKLLIFLGLLLSYCLSFGQNLAKDIEQDWYLNFRNSDHIPDTLTLNLYSNDPSVLPPHYRIWHYRKGVYDRADIETRNGIWDPLTIVEQWKVVKSKGKEHLIIKIIRNPVNHKKSNAIFIMQPTYNHGKLVKIVLVKVRGEYS